MEENRVVVAMVGRGSRTERVGKAVKWAYGEASPHCDTTHAPKRKSVNQR